MDITITSRILSGGLAIIPSKSQAHRLLICAAFADGPTAILCPDTNDDIEATAACLRPLCAHIRRMDWGYEVTPLPNRAAFPKQIRINCRESGSTLRFLLPIMGALGVDATFSMEGRLPQRPLSPLWEEMERMGCRLAFISSSELRCTGQLCAGEYRIDGGVSSQFITGLLFAASLLDGDSIIRVTGTLESRPYVDLTQQAMAAFGVYTDDFRISGGQVYHSPGQLEVESDWSNAAFWVVANALGSAIALHNLNDHSSQGDRAVVTVLEQMKNRMPTVSARDIPDLVPVLAVAAANHHGAVFTDIRRLRMKESDRVASTVAMLERLGGRVEATSDTLTVYPAALTGGTVDAVNDHRIAMATAVAAIRCTGPVTILGADCVRKSYPRFWEDYRKLGGNYELYLR